MNNLAIVLNSQGKYEEAEQMHRQTLALRETVLGREHPDTLDSMNNLALVLDSQGKYEEAEQTHRQTLALMETVLGREHPDTLASMNNLANVLDSQGKYEEADQMHRQTLALMETDRQTDVLYAGGLASRPPEGHAARRRLSILYTSRISCKSSPVAL